MEVDKVADMASDKKMTDMLLHMVADKEVDKVDDMVAGHGRWLIGPKLFRPEAYHTCMSSKLCEFIRKQLLPKLWKEFNWALSP